jgi:hypothetical protein
MSELFKKYILDKIKYKYKYFVTIPHIKKTKGETELQEELQTELQEEVQTELQEEVQTNKTLRMSKRIMETRRISPEKLGEKKEQTYS